MQAPLPNPTTTLNHPTKRRVAYSAPTLDEQVCDKTVWLLTLLSLIAMCDVTLLTRHSCQVLAWAVCCGTCLVASFGCRPCPVIRVWCLRLLQAQQQKVAQLKLETLSRRALDEWTVSHVLPAHASLQAPCAQSAAASQCYCCL